MPIDSISLDSLGKLPLISEKQMHLIHKWIKEQENGKDTTKKVKKKKVPLSKLSKKDTASSKVDTDLDSLNGELKSGKLTRDSLLKIIQGSP